MEKRAQGWALITGASSGIGRELALRIARGKKSVVLIGRDAAALEQVAAECRRQEGVEALPLVRDLTESGVVREIYETVAWKGIFVDTLVNNAGSALFGPFVETAIEDDIAMVNLQLVAMLDLTRRFLPAMIEHRRGRLLNVASLYSFTPVPMQSVYGACKAFLLSFSDALREEVAPHGITVTVLCPGGTATKFRTRAGVAEKSSKLLQSAEEVASAGYLALRQGRALSIPGFTHWLFVQFLRHAPRFCLPRVMRRINERRGVNQAR